MTLREHAYSYAGLGLAVFPVSATTKRPIISQHTATTDLDTIEHWWERWPDASIGHRIPPDQTLLDIDPRHGGHRTWKALRAEMPPFTTRTHMSGREDGGGHVWFTRPPVDLGVARLNTWAKDHEVGADLEGRWTAGIDLLTHEHRYTILPPSPHAQTGRPYRWAKGRGLALEPIPMPALLVDLLTRPAQAPTELGDGYRQADSIADWFSHNIGFGPVLRHAGWEPVTGTGDQDGDEWRHPTATTAVSATIKHGCLFVYSTSTPFQPTEAGDPHGYTPFAAWALLEHAGNQSAAATAARALQARNRTAVPVGADKPEEDTASIFIDWPAFWASTTAEDEWLYEDVLALGRAHAIYAARKQGKSLFTLFMVAELAVARDDIDVIYLDYEMTENDVRERLEDMGYGPHADLTRLHYALLPSLPPLDTMEGAAAALALVDNIGHNGRHIVVIIDTTGRAVEGDENSADTIRAFYAWTGIALKRRGVTWARLDHAGKDPEKGQRGSSAKGDDVDIVWQLQATDNGIELRRRLARMAWVPEHVRYNRGDDPLTFTRVRDAYPAGTSQLVAELDRLDVPLGAGRTTVRRTLREAGVGARNEVLSAAMRFRRERPQPLTNPVDNPVDNPEKPVPRPRGQVATTTCPQTLGTATPENGSDQGGDRSGDRWGQVPAVSGDRWSSRRGDHCPPRTDDAVTEHDL